MTNCPILFIKNTQQRKENTKDNRNRDIKHYEKYTQYREKLRESVE